MKSLFSGSISLSVFAVFSYSLRRFDSQQYKGESVSVAIMVPTIYGVGIKTYVSNSLIYTCVGLGLFYPVSMGVSYSYSTYKYVGSIQLPNSITNFLQKETKGLKP